MTSWHDCLTALDGLANLQDGWHGPDSKKPQAGQITAAWRFLRWTQSISADMPHAITLTDDGHVALEWRRLDKHASSRIETITASLFELTSINLGEQKKYADYFQVKG